MKFHWLKSWEVSHWESVKMYWFIQWKCYYWLDQWKRLNKSVVRITWLNLWNESLEESFIKFHRESLKLYWFIQWKCYHWLDQWKRLNESVLWITDRISEINHWMNQSFHSHWFISVNIFNDFTSERAKSLIFQWIPTLLIYSVKISLIQF